MSATNSRIPRGCAASRPALRLVTSHEQSLHITVRPGTDVDAVALIVATGEIDDNSVPRLRAAIAELITRRRYIVVDLDEATLADAMVLPELIDATCTLVEHDVTLLFTTDPRTMMMLKVADPPG